MYYVFESLVGSPARLMDAKPFSGLRAAILYARSKAKDYEDSGYTVDTFNGNDWLWYCVKFSDSTDLGIMIQILLTEEVNLQLGG